MLTTRDAARLLAAVRSTEDLSAITHALGFSPPVPLGKRAKERFFGPAAAGPIAGADPKRTQRTPGTPLPQRVSVAAAGHDGTLRALLVEWSGTALSALRARIAPLNRALPREAPDLRWLVVAIDRPAGSLVIAAPSGAGPRTSALDVELDHVMESDAETLAMLAACGLTTGDADLLVHLRWRETLGRDALTRRFYRDLEQRVHTLAWTATGNRVDEAARRTIALLHTSRLLFLAFLEAKGWLNRDRSFLRRAFEDRSGGRGAHERMLHPLFFGTLNTPAAKRAPTARAFGRVPFLNGGLFARTPLETRHRTLRFTDEALGDVIIGLLGNYRLTAREASAEWSDAAVDPEMLGRAFESLMGAADRRAHGAFYTPRPLIERLTQHALFSDDGPAPTDPSALVRLDALRILDPACGSGAFLVYALERLAERRLVAGDQRELAVRRRHALARNIFGVDVDPIAVWLCQLRLWLSVVVEDETMEPWRLAPLPNLDRNIREGDALSDGPPRSTGEAATSPLVAVPDRSLDPLRLRYVRASGVRKRSLGRALDRAERQRAIAAAEHTIERVAAERRDLLLAVRSRDLFRERRAPDAATRRDLLALRSAARAARASLRRLRDGAALPFSFATHFPEATHAGGFDVILGNPPWVRPHALAPAMRDALRERFFTYRCAAWPEGAAAAAAGRGFSSQADLSALFTERAVQLAAPGGVVALLLPAKLWIALAGGGVRRLLAAQAPPVAIETWHGGTAGFDAAVYPSVLVARVLQTPRVSDPAREHAEAPHTTREVTLALHHEPTSNASQRPPDTWRIPRASLALDDSPGAPWLLLPRRERCAFDRLAAAGVPLASSALGRPILGVKTGCNDAFIVSGSTTLDSSLLRPLARGEDLRAWRISRSSTRILWTHDEQGEPLRTLPRQALEQLRPWRSRLERRSDGRGDRWWALFRTEAARSDRARVVWGDIGRSVRAAVLEAGDHTVPLNTCYVVRTALADDAYALAALLNSRVMLAWLRVLAEPARGGYRRFLGWTCARLPVPRDWLGARAALAPIARAGAAGDPLDEDALTEAVLHAFHLARADVAALMDHE